jgi:hypothetical protein
MGARNLNQSERSLNVLGALDKKTDPPGLRENMMRRHAIATLHQPVAVRFPNKTIEQTVSVDVAAFFSAKEEPNSSKAMHPWLYTRQLPHARFDVADSAETRPIKEGRRTQQDRIEKLRGAGNHRQPS